MISPAHGTTVLDGMATLAGVRPARVAPERPVAPVEPVRRTFDDRVDLSPGAREALAQPRPQVTPAAGEADTGVGRLIDVLA